VNARSGHSGGRLSSPGSIADETRTVALTFWLIPLAVLLAVAVSLWRDARARRSGRVGTARPRNGLGWNWWAWKGTILAFGGIAFLTRGEWLWGAFAVGAAAWHYAVARSRRSSPDVDNS
jgi:hypothetical protein